MKNISSLLLCLCLGSFALPAAAIEEITNATPIGASAAPIKSAVPVVPAAPKLKKTSLTFMDSKLFDTRLAKELDSGKDEVVIEISGHMPLNNIPARVDRWLVTSADEGGTVETLPSPQKTYDRGLIAIIPMVFDSFGGFLKKMNEERMYGTIKQYDTKIYYRKSENGDSLIDRIVLVKRKPAEHH